MTSRASEKSIFLAALEKGSADARAAYLDQACAGDTPMRAQLEELLAAHDRLDSLPPEPAANIAPTIAQPGPSLPGRVIGPYKLLQQIGEGGMGAVYMAEQTRPVQRQVALKLVKPGFDNRQVIARFEAERQALALMDHPNIAKVLDAGTTESGQPYFVMELVHGVPITKYCDEHRLTPRQRLELFVPVCHAIQHAHQKGIIHRDIKPSNVLIAQYDGKPVPKVIDFGVAKATGSKLTESTMFTEFGSIVGTLEYMSPEQADRNQLDIDTRSDIYSLGVLLYELLTGSTPLDKRHLRSAAILELLRIIKEEEPPKPSTRLSTTDELPSIAANRNLEPKKLSGLVRGELDWIVMKSLEKDRNRRYETANGFAMDVQRYLADEPVLACPPSAAYRFRKFARRNKAAIATGTLISAALVATVAILAVSNVVVTHERNAKDAALSEKVQALGEKQTALGEKEAALAQSQANFAEAKRQEGLAKEQQQIATEQTMLAKRRLYASQMNLAMQAWRAGEAPRVLELLEGQRPKIGEEDLRGFEWFYLWRLCNGGRVYLKGHTDSVLSLSYSPDGKTLASTGGDSTIRLWDTATGHQRLVLRTLVPWDVIFSPDGQILACGGKTTPEVTLWNAATGEVLHKIPGSVDRLAFSPDGKTLLGGGLSTRLWNVASGEERRAVPEEAGFMVGMLPDGKTVVTLAGQHSESCEVRFWDSENGARRLTIPAPGLNYAVLSPDGARLATTGWWSVKVWDTTTGQLQSSYATQSDMRGAAFSPDGKRLAAAEGRCAAVWDLETGVRLGQDVHRGVVWAVAFSPDSQTVASSTLGGDVKLWDMSPPDEASSIAIREARDLRFSPDGRTLLVGNPGPTSTVDVSAGKEIGVLPVRGIRTFSAGGATAARLAAGTPAVVFDTTSGRELAHLPLPTTTGGTPGITLSEDGQHAATFFSFRGDSTVKLWDIATQQVRTLTNDVGQIAVNCAEFSPDGKLLAAGFQFQWVVVWDVATGKVKLQFVQQPSMLWIKSVKFSPDSKALAVGTDLGAVTLWDIESGLRLADFRGHTSHVHSLAFSPDGKVLATAGADKTVRLWDTRTAQERSTLTGHAGQVSRVMFSPDGNTLATASANDGTVRLWRASQELEAKAFRTQLDPDEPDSQAALLSAARRLTAAGRAAEAQLAYEKLLSPFRKAIELDPNDANAHAELGAALRAQGKLDEAIACFRKAIELDPKHGTAYTALSHVLKAQGNSDEATTTLLKAIEFDANPRAAHTNLAWWLATDADPKLRDPKAAVIHARKAIDLAPEDPNHWSNLGVALWRAGDVKTAVETLEKADSMYKDGDHFHRFFLAMAYWQVGENDKARQAYRQAVEWMGKHQPKHVELHRFRAEAEELLGMKQK